MPAKALVVDDSRAMRSILAKILARLGFEVLQAADGREAIAVLYAQPEPFDLVLSDWNMPEMDGLQFLKALRANPKFSEVIVVMVTTETHIEQMMAAQAKLSHQSARTSLGSRFVRIDAIRGEAQDRILGLDRASPTALRAPST